MINSLRYLLKEGVRNIWCNRMMSLASVGVLVSCLLMTGAAVLFSMNINTAMKSIEGNNSIKVYIKQDVPVLTALKIGDEIRKLDNVESCEFISKEDALSSVMGMLGENDADLLSGMSGDDNPLPDAFQISMNDLSKYKETAAKIQSIDGVDSINDYSDIAQKLTNLDHLVTTAGFWIILLLSLVSVFILSNTIRVTMFSRRLEISIMKSVGATNWFVRVPFLVEGVILGLISGVLGSVILHLLYSKLVGAVTSITLFSPIDISAISVSITLWFLAAGALFGAMGGLISIGRYLKKERGDIVDW